MQIMAEKGLVARDLSSRTHTYSAKLPQAQTQRQFVTDMIAKVFGGSSAQLVMHALSTHSASKEELAEIKELIDSKKGEKTR
jgi:predicted transcriptional regulator